jgi:hypothetical protein
MRPEDSDLVHLSYKPYFFSQRTMFFSHNKTVSVMTFRGNSNVVAKVVLGGERNENNMCQTLEAWC